MMGRTIGRRYMFLQNGVTKHESAESSLEFREVIRSRFKAEIFILLQSVVVFSLYLMISHSPAP